MQASIAPRCCSGPTICYTPPRKLAATASPCNARTIDLDAEGAMKNRERSTFMVDRYITLKGGDAVGRAVAGRTVIAGECRAEIRSAAYAVGAALHIEEMALVRVGQLRVGDRARVAGKSVDAGDDRRGDTRSADDVEPGRNAVRLIHIDAGSRV